MLGIALRYGIALEELREANPDVDPRMLSIDTILIVPFGESEPQVLPAPTPLPLPLEDPECYLNAEGGAWCLLLVKNNYQRALENLNAWINLYSPEGESVAVEEAVSPLNVLPPGEALPLVALFPPPLPEEFIPMAEQFSALPVSRDDSRYLQADLQPGRVSIDPTGLFATVQGQIVLPEGRPAAGLIWLAAVAYGEDGEVVGMRKWEIEQPCGEMEQPEQAGDNTPAAGQEEPEQEELPPVSCEPVPFEITVYSLGPAIERVEVLVEARP